MLHSSLKVFRVVTERDGQKTKKPGTLSVEIAREEFRYAASHIVEVWAAIDWLRLDPERTLIAIIEEFPSIVVLPVNE